jgi:hypothetical protein
VEFHGPKPSYSYPLDAPELGDTQGPNCYGLPNPPLTLPTMQFNDGTQDDVRFAGRNGHTDAVPLSGALQFNSTPGPNGTTPADPLAGALNKVLGQSAATPGSPSMGDAGTASERAEFDQILGPILGRPATSVPAVASLLWGPMARGSQVNVG